MLYKLKADDVRMPQARRDTTVGTTRETEIAGQLHKVRRMTGAFQHSLRVNKPLVC